MNTNTNTSTNTRKEQKMLTKPQAFERAIDSVITVKSFLEREYIDFSQMKPDDIFKYMKILDELEFIIQSVTDKNGNFKYRGKRINN